MWGAQVCEDAGSLAKLPQSAGALLPPHLTVICQLVNPRVYGLCNKGFTRTSMTKRREGLPIRLLLHVNST